MDEKKYKLICVRKGIKITQERLIEKMLHLDLTTDLALGHLRVEYTS